VCFVVNEFLVLIFTRRWRSWDGRAGIDGGTGVPAVSDTVSARVDTYDAKRYTGLQMIRSFACPETEKLFNDESSRRLPTQIQRVARRKLLLLNQARSLNDLRVPYGNHLEALKDDRKGQHSIRVNDQWRICFRWHGEDAFDVEIADYH
jgi:proteic killer suppression protein